MKTLPVGQFKAQFSSVVDDLRRGEQVMITYGRKREPLATIIPQSQLKKPDYSIPIGTLKDKGWTYSMHNFEMTDEEFLNS